MTTPAPLSAPGPAPGPSGLRQARVQWLVWLGTMVVIGVLIAFTQWREYANTDATEREHLQTQVRVAERILNGQVASVDAALRTMLAGIDRWRGADDSYLPFAQEHLKRVEAMMPGAESFLVLDAFGACQLSSAPRLIGLDFSGSAFFAEVRKDLSSGHMHLSEPQLSAISEWSVIVSRPIFMPDGRFGGLVAAALSPDYFQSLMANLRYSEDMQVSLVHGKGGIYVSSPSRTSSTLPALREGDNLFSRHQASGSEESFFHAVRADGHALIGMVRTVTPQGGSQALPFVAVASRDLDVVYGQWTRDSLRHSAIFVGLCLLSGAMLWLYQRKEARAQAQEEVYHRELQRSNQRFEQIAGTIPCVLFDFEVQAGQAPSILYVGPYCRNLLQFEPADMLGSGQRFFEGLHPDDEQMFSQVWAQALDRRHPLSVDFRFLRQGSELLWLRMSAIPAAKSAPDGKTHWSGYLIDISDSKFHELAMQTLAYQDPLTNANNRRSFLDKLQLEFERVHRTHAQAALIMLDVDFFKRINDTHGHDVGDEALQHLVQLLHQQLRSIDTLGRLGGEEFAVLLPETGRDAAVHLAERLRQTVEASPLQARTGTLQFTISLGVASMDGHTTDVNAVIKQADLAMYQAKHAGRNRVCVADSTAPA